MTLFVFANLGRGAHVASRFLASNKLTVLGLLILILLPLGHACGTGRAGCPEPLNLGAFAKFSTSVGTGATATVALSAAYTSAFPGCGIGAEISDDGDALTAFVQGMSCLPPASMTIATITVRRADATLFGVFVLQTDGSLLELVDVD